MKISSEVEVCNLALLRINQVSISSLDENSLEARACKLNFQQSKSYLLAQYPWTFATFRAILIKVDDNSLWEYSNKYQLPPEFLRMLAIYDSGNNQLTSITGAKSPYVLEGGYILSNYSGLKMKYIKDIDNIVSFSPEFIDCLVLDLALRLTKYFNDSTSYLQLLMSEFERKFTLAKNSDCQQTLIGGMLNYPLLAESMEF
ncbi:MAG: hypothetical protein LBQ08_05090 [Holosporaceae bacterium]|jgi:hypothetical protein|nr:hypothetical protein [Holosporaceae bacterium]